MPTLGHWVKIGPTSSSGVKWIGFLWSEVDWSLWTVVGLWTRTVHHSPLVALTLAALRAREPVQVRGTQRGLAGATGCSCCVRLRSAGAQPRTRGCGAATPLLWRAAIRCCGPRRAARSQEAARQTTRYRGGLAVASLHAPCPQLRLGASGSHPPTIARPLPLAPPLTRFPQQYT